MKKYKLYVMPGSESSQEAERLLEKSGLAYEKIVVDNVELINAVVYEFGIKKHRIFTPMASSIRGWRI